MSEEQKQDQTQGQTQQQNPQNPPQEQDGRKVSRYSMDGETVEFESADSEIRRLKFQAMRRAARQPMRGISFIQLGEDSGRR